MGYEYLEMFHSVAQRIYENEIDMLVRAAEAADEKYEVVFPEFDNVFKRMPQGLEEQLFEAFERYKAEHRDEK